MGVSGLVDFKVLLQEGKTTPLWLQRFYNFK